MKIKVGDIIMNNSNGRAWEVIYMEDTRFGVSNIKQFEKFSFKLIETMEAIKEGKYSLFKKEEIEEQILPVKLTFLERKVLNAMRDNEYEDALETGGTFVFTVVDNSGICERKARGVIASLIKKGLVKILKDDENNMINFTDKGKDLFNNSKGSPCSWGRQRLLAYIDK